MCCSRALGAVSELEDWAPASWGPLARAPLQRHHVLARGTEPQVRGGLGLGEERRRELGFMRRTGECSLATRRADMPAYFKRKSDLKLRESPVPHPSVALPLMSSQLLPPPLRSPLRERLPFPSGPSPLLPRLPALPGFPQPWASWSPGLHSCPATPTAWSQVEASFRASAGFLSPGAAEWGGG